MLQHYHILILDVSMFQPSRFSAHAICFDFSVSVSFLNMFILASKWPCFEHNRYTSIIQHIKNVTLIYYLQVHFKSTGMMFQLFSPYFTILLTRLWCVLTDSRNITGAKFSKLQRSSFTWFLLFFRNTIQYHLKFTLRNITWNLEKEINTTIFHLALVFHFKIQKMKKKS